MRVDPLPCVSTTNTPAIPRRVNLTERSWPFVGSFALHAVLFEILFFPVLPPPSVVSSQEPTVLWFSPFVVPGDSGHTTSILSKPAVVLAQQTETAEPVSADRPEDPIASDDSTAYPAPVPTTVAETESIPANADLVVIQSPPNVRSKADRIPPNPVPAPRQTMPPSPPVVKRNPVLLSSEPAREKQQALPAEQPVISRADQKQSYLESSERQDEAERLSRESADQERALAEIAQQEQLVRRQQALQALREESERERLAAEEMRREQEAREKQQQERRIQEEQERLAAERTRQMQKAREQEQQALLNQAELKRAAAEKARQEREAQDQLLRERKFQQEQERLAVERKHQAQKAREQEQQALREQAELKRVAAEKARREREAQEQLLRERKLQEEALRRKEREKSLEQPVRQPLVVAVKQQENPASKVPENKSGDSSAQKPQKGLSLPLLKGDFKLVVTGATPPKITITFKEFALSRRNRPFSRVEARRESVVAPLTATTKEYTREVVIEKVRPGVYAVTVEPVAGSSDFTFLLKLHEGTSRMSVRDLGRHTLAHKKVLLKILMPDGILWDDNKSFTGSMEDSDSVTKFNAETGLTWKEYSD